VKILVLNSGSSSIKFKLFDSTDWTVLASGGVSRIGEEVGEARCDWLDADGQPRNRVSRDPIPDHGAGLEHIMTGLRDSGALGDAGELAAIGHRVVHGGEAFHTPTRVDDAVVQAIRDMIPLAPLHNPANLEGIVVARERFPQVPSIAVFDTAFHQTMPEVAYRYALPARLYREHRVRRYGFHGTSHAYVSKRAAGFLGKPLDACNLITLHLGNGASACAVRGGRSVDTSMGMTPLEGLVMGTRCGDLDPAIHFYLMKELGLDTASLDRILNRESGLLGICGDNDMRGIQQRAAAGDADAELAVAITAHRLRKYLGAYYAELGQVDGVVFTGGIGENDARLRERVCSGLERLGIRLDPHANAAGESGERRISASESDVALLVIPTDEEREIAEQSLAAVQRKA
jgi:acetate kinase